MAIGDPNLPVSRAEKWRCGMVSSGTLALGLASAYPDSDWFIRWTGRMKLTEQQLTRSIYSLWDFQQALSALTFLLEDCVFESKYTPVEMRRFRCYESTLIISMARPFEKSRGGNTLNLGAVGLRFDKTEWMLIERIMLLRRRIVAHSDEEEMHFRTSTFPVFEGEFNFPHMQFDERFIWKKRNSGS